MLRPTLPLVTFALSTLTATAVQAHIAMTEPAPRHPDQKLGPCGLGANDPRGPEVTVFQGGETITVRWTETIDHPGHFRISFDPDGQDDFGDPAAYDDYYSNPAVLVDQIADKAGAQQMYEQDVTLPMMSCDTCTLQLVQVMTDKPPYEVGTNDLYYQCADIILEGAAETTGDATTGGTTGDSTTGGTSGDATTGNGTSGAATTGNGSDPTTGGGNGTTGSGTSGGTDTTGSTGGGASGGTDGADDPGESGCGCNGGGAGGAGLGALLLLMRRRRRG